MTIIYPYYFRILERQADGWALTGMQIFYNHDDRTYNLDDIWADYGITKQKLIIELFREFEGKLGYYLADLKHKKYYYCGLTDKDIQETLYSIGIGRRENA